MSPAFFIMSPAFLFQLGKIPQKSVCEVNAAQMHNSLQFWPLNADKYLYIYEKLAKSSMSS